MVKVVKTISIDPDVAEYYSDPESLRYTPFLKQSTLVNHVLKIYMETENALELCIESYPDMLRLFNKTVDKLDLQFAILMGIAKKICNFYR